MEEVETISFFEPHVNRIFKIYLSVKQMLTSYRFTIACFQVCAYVQVCNQQYSLYDRAWEAMCSLTEPIDV